MSQQGALSSGSPVPSNGIISLTADAGGPVFGDPSNNINIFADNSSGIDDVGNPGTNTITISAFTATTLQKGTVLLASNAQAIAGTDTNNSVTSSALAAKLGTQTTHSVALFEGSTSALSPSNVGSNGQVLLGATAADPAFATLTSSDGSISFTTGANSLSLQVSGGTTSLTSLTGNTGVATPTGGTISVLGSAVAATGVPVATAASANQLLVDVQRSSAIVSTNAANVGLAAFNSAHFSVDGNGFVSTSGTGIANTITGNSGGAISPTAGNWNTVGTGSITIAGAGSTLTTQLTGLTNHNVLVGAGTTTITNVAPSATAGVPLVSNGAAADPSFSTALIAGGGTASTSFNTTGIVISGATSTTALTAVTLTDGQLAIGSSSGNPAAANLTAGTGISISNAANSITINATGTGLTWTNVTGTSQTIAGSNGYLSNNAGTVAFTLPASATFGDTFEIVGVQGAWTVAQAANQQIKYGSTATTVGVTGSLSSTNAGDCFTCTATNTSASTVWRVTSSIGNITVT